jgi:hypothetical protein
VPPAKSAGLAVADSAAIAYGQWATSTGSEYLSDEAALESLNTDLDGAPISEPNFLKFRAGIRRKSWNKNVGGVGAGFGLSRSRSNRPSHPSHPDRHLRD